jgi:hypothetical protein
VWLQASSERGVSQTVHVLIATYNEPAELVKECVLRLLVAPEPIYMEKIIWICDDGYMKEEGKQKQRMVADLQNLGLLPLISVHTVHSIATRIQLRSALNCSSCECPTQSSHAFWSHAFWKANSHMLVDLQKP